MATTDGQTDGQGRPPCRHFDMTFKNGDRVMVCLGCQKFWPLPRKSLGVRETLSQWVEERGSILLAVLVSSLVLSLLVATIKVCMSPDFQLLYSVRPR